MRYFGEFVYFEVECEEPGCTFMAVDQDTFDGLLCELHYLDAVESEKGDLAAKYAKENP